MIILGSNYRASGPPVYLPITEAAADANTFVCAFDGGANANETGVGLGLTGANLVFTQVGSVGGTSGGFRPIADVNKRFTCTVPFLQAFINGAEWTLLHRVKNFATTTGKYYLNIDGTALFNNGVVKAGYLGVQFNSSGATSPALSLPTLTAFANNIEYWLAMWKKSGVLHFGYVAASAANPPTGWDSFPQGQRACVYGVPGFTADAWETIREIVGFGGSSAIFEIGTVVASKVGLAAAPV